jgi:hypothetical protein
MEGYGTTQPVTRGTQSPAATKKRFWNYFPEGTRRRKFV